MDDERFKECEQCKRQQLHIAVKVGKINHFDGANGGPPEVEEATILQCAECGCLNLPVSSDES